MTATERISRLALASGPQQPLSEELLGRLIRTTQRRLASCTGDPYAAREEVRELACDVAEAATQAAFARAAELARSCSAEVALRIEEEAERCHQKGWLP